MALETHSQAAGSWMGRTTRCGLQRAVPHPTYRGGAPRMTAQSRRRHRPRAHGRPVVGSWGGCYGASAMTESTAPGGPPATERPPSTPPDAGRSLSSLVLHLSEGFDASTNVSDLLRTAGRHCRKLVDCEVARIWVARRAGTRL